MATRIKIDSKKLKANTAKLNNLKVAITAADDIVVENSSKYFYNMQRKFSNAYRTTKDYIKNVADTPTGRERKALGLGPAGRYETGAMYDAFIMTPGGGTTRKGKGKVRFFAEMGWLKGMPEYTLFQEYGTKNGIKAMNALDAGRYDLRTQIEDDHARDIKEMERQIAEGFFFALRKGLVSRTSQPNATWWNKSKVDEEGN